VKEVGVYHKKGGEWVELLPEVVNWRTGSVLKNIATAGLVKGDINGFMLGSDGRNSVKSLVEILIYAAEGVAITDYQLLRLRQKGDQREFRIVTGGIFHAPGGAKRDMVQLGRASAGVRGGCWPCCSSNSLFTETYGSGWMSRSSRRDRSPACLPARQRSTGPDVHVLAPEARAVK
jgi:hypothetical protein